MDIKRISVEEAKTLRDRENAVFVDVRDPGSYAASHIEGAVLVNDQNLAEFLAAADKSRAHVLYCYSGNSSQGGAAYFQEQGFQKVYSMDGGFAAWDE